MFFAGQEYVIYPAERIVQTALMAPVRIISALFGKFGKPIEKTGT
jgi:hypothetical protein